jgi:hypothetical protein
MVDNLVMDIPCLDWLLKCDEPWTRFRTRIDLLNQSLDHPGVLSDRADMLAHPQVKTLVKSFIDEWGSRPLTRHNDSSHALHRLTILADFGIQSSDPSMDAVIGQVMAHVSPEGLPQTLVNIPVAFGGAGQEQWSWMLCDAPTLLASLLAICRAKDERLQTGLQTLTGMVLENGYPCKVAPELGKFRGPGKKADPCPIANLLVLKALALSSEFQNNPAAHIGVETLLGCWERRATNKYYLFGMGIDFQKLKYPFIWYDLFHVLDVLSRYPFARSDPRFIEMLDTLRQQADTGGCYTATSMYQPWKGWSFADKKNPSPWLTMLAWRILARCSTE